MKQVPFPSPDRISPGVTRWSPGKIAAFEESRGLNLPPLIGMATDVQLAGRYNVGRATIWRWAKRGEQEAAGPREDAA